MTSEITRFFVRLNLLLRSEDAQDLIEYALLVAIVAFGATASMHTLASKIAASFTGIGSTLSATIT